MSFGGLSVVPRFGPHLFPPPRDAGESLPRTRSGDAEGGLNDLNPSTSLKAGNWNVWNDSADDIDYGGAPNFFARLNHYQAPSAAG